MFKLLDSMSFILKSILNYVLMLYLIRLMENGLMTSTKQEIIELLLSGTDERTTLNDRGLSNYGIDFADESLTNRGSCTCNFITSKHVEYLADRIGTTFILNKIG